MLIIKDYFEGNSNVTKTYQEDMMGFRITNDHDTAPLTFTINSITISVKPKETFRGKFLPSDHLPFIQLFLFALLFQHLLMGLSSPLDTTPPNEVTNLTASNVTAHLFNFIMDSFKFQ